MNYLKEIYYQVFIALMFLSFAGYAQKINLPIEVLGEEGKIEEITFTISTEQQAAVDLLWLQVNNLGYEDKASVKINSSEWVDLNHNTVNIQSPEKERGGMAHGGYNTIRFSLPSTGIVSGLNKIQFRFNMSDAISNGYRVINLNLLDPFGKHLLDNNYFEEEDPFTWKSPYYDTVNNKEPDDLAAKIDQGKNLWYYADLESNYLESGKKGFWYGYQLEGKKPINAKCASCHTQDGRDLEIFSYSNKSIIERTKFHMLTEEEGKLIATYIRSLSDEHDNVGRYGRPWNPPYQPGPEIANRPIEQWAAGAGLDAILEEDKDMLPYMFPDGVDQEKVYDRFDSDKMVDRTIMPIAIQFPDWKHWLPMVHPMDAYTKNNHWNDPFSNVDPIQGGQHYFHHPKKAYEDFRAYLEAMPPANRNKDELMAANRTFWFHYRGFLAIGQENSNHWRTPNGTATQNLADDVPREFAATSLARLMAVQFFEIMNEFDLQDKAHWFAPPEDQPGERQWFGYIYQVFEIPPHFQASVSESELPIDDGYNIIGDGRNFYGQSPAAGVYESTNWYHLQLVVNGGNGMVSDVSPVDYNYTPDFIVKASSTSGVYEPLRYYHSLNAMYQTRSWSGATSPTNGKGFKIRVQGPWHIIGRTDRHNLNDFKATVWPTFLDDIKPGMSKWVLNAQLRQFLTEVRKPENNLNDWERTTNGTSTKLDNESKTTEDLKDMEYIMGKLDYWADKMYLLFPEFSKLGVDCQILEEMLDWCNEAWPNIDWSIFRNTGELQLELLTEESDDCVSDANTITAQVFNEGEDPIFEWWVNEEKVINSSKSLDISELRPGSNIKCRVISSKSCISNVWIEDQVTLPDTSFKIQVRKNEGEWETLNNTIACIDDTMEFKMDLELQEPLFWLDAMDVNNNGTKPTEGSAISKWSNKSSSGHTMITQTNLALRPTYSKTGMNGLPGVMFGMNDADGLELFSADNDNVLNEDWTLVLVGKYFRDANGGGDWNSVLGNEDGNSGLGFHFERSKGRSRIKYKGDNIYGRAYEDGSNITVMIKKEGKKMYLYINGKLEQEIESSSANMESSRAFYLGQRDNGNPNAGWFHKGPISEVLFYNKAISNTQKDYLEGYLMHKWKFAQSLSLNHLYREHSPLYVNMETPYGESLVFDYGKNSEIISLNLNEKFGDYIFNSPRSSCAESNVKISISNANQIGSDLVKYSVNNKKFKIGLTATADEESTFELSTNYEFSGDYQWEKPNGELLALNTDPDPFILSLSNNQDKWKLHVKTNVETCILTDQVYEFTLTVTEIPYGEKDDDNDGVKNDLDECPNTVEGAIVDARGCLNIPVNNFTIETIGETCLDKDNGMIIITALQPLSYSVSINGADAQSFDSTFSHTIDNLSPGEYSICITIAEEPSYEQCYNLTIGESEAVTGKIVTTKSNNVVSQNIRITSGTPPYSVAINGETRFTTHSNSFAVQVNHGDQIVVSSKLNCEGLLVEDVNLSDHFYTYPNPTNDMLNVVIPNIDLKEVKVVVYNSLQQRVLEKNYKLVSNTIKIPLGHVSNGIYFIKLELETPINLKVVKQ